MPTKLYALIVLLPAICNSNIIECIGDQKCKDENKICLDAEPCSITCNGTTDGEQACQQAKIDGTLATNVTLDCIQKQDCQDTKLICGTGICSIHCHGNNGGDEQCKFTRLECGVGPCIIHCDGPDSCHDSDFIFSSTVSFECIGHCPQSFPAPFVHSTSIPTISPTISPTTIVPTTIFPTRNPVESPTTNPVKSPTHHTKYPTGNPSKTPTLMHINPTINTTKYPTFTPSMSNDEIMESEKDILDNIPLMVIFSLMLLVLICMSFICIFYVRKMRNLKKKQKRNSDKNIQDNKQKNNNIPVNLVKDEHNEELEKAKSISEKIAFKDDAASYEGCTAIQMGELDVFDKENSELMNDTEFIVEADSEKYIYKKTMDYIKTPSNSFSNENRMDIELNEDEFVIDGESDSDANSKYGKITEGN